MASPNTTQWQPKAIIFDLLTALLDSWTLWDASTPSGSSDEGLRWRKRYLGLTYGSTEYVPYEGLVLQAARDSGLPDEAAERLCRDWDHIKPWPEVGEVLDKLKTKGYSLGVITNCSRLLGHAAARLAVVDCKVVEGFDAVITAEESGFYKPTLQAYLAGLEMMKLKPEDVLFVAGSAGDVEGASKAGMKVVWHNHIGLDKKGDAVPLRQGMTLDDTLEDFL